MTRLKSAAVLVALVLVAALPLGAQTLTARTVVNIPFEFVANEKTLPPGDYTIEVVNSQALKLTGPTDSVFVITNEASGSQELTETKLVFTQQNGQHVLHQVWTAGQPHIHDLAHPAGTPQPK